MTSGHATGRSVAAAVLLASVMAGVWSWQRMVCRARTTDVKSEPWEKIKTEYPIIQDAPETPQISSQTIDTMVQANPFSPARRLPPAPAGGEASGGARGNRRAGQERRGLERLVSYVACDASGGTRRGRLRNRGNADPRFGAARLHRAGEALRAAPRGLLREGWGAVAGRACPHRLGPSAGRQRGGLKAL